MSSAPPMRVSQSRLLETTEAVEKVPVPPNPYALAAGRGHIWVTGLGTRTLTRIEL